MDSVTNIEWAVSWLGGCGTQKREGEMIRAYGKDDRNHLVAIRTDSGVYPVRNLAAVMHAESRATSA